MLGSLAAHLSRQGEHAQAIRLVEADAATVLLYGDVAAFNADERRAVLQQLDRHDPYFRVIESADSAIGALAQPDLATEFESVLRNPLAHVESHRLSTVYDALTIGRPIPELRSLLRDIALDASRPEWHRARAADAWMHYPDAVSREFFDALYDEPPTLARALLRLHVAARFAGELNAAEIQSLIADFALTPEDDVVGRLNELTDALPSRSIDGFFTFLCIPGCRMQRAVARTPWTSNMRWMPFSA